MKKHTNLLGKDSQPIAWVIEGEWTRSWHTQPTKNTMETKGSEQQQLWRSTPLRNDKKCSPQPVTRAIEDEAAKATAPTSCQKKNPKLATTRIWSEEKGEGIENAKKKPTKRKRQKKREGGRKEKKKKREGSAATEKIVEV